MDMVIILENTFATEVSMWMEVTDLVLVKATIERLFFSLLAHKDYGMLKSE